MNYMHLSEYQSSLTQLEISEAQEVKGDQKASGEIVNRSRTL